MLRFVLPLIDTHPPERRLYPAIGLKCNLGRKTQVNILSEYYIVLRTVFTYQIKLIGGTRIEDKFGESNHNQDGYSYVL